MSRDWDVDTIVLPLSVYFSISLTHIPLSWSYTWDAVPLCYIPQKSLQNGTKHVKLITEALK